MAIIGVRADGSVLKRSLSRRTKALRFWGESLTEIHLECLEKAPALESLELSGNKTLQTLDLGPLAAHCKHLRSISIESIAPVDLCPLASCADLEVVAVHCRSWPTVDLAPLAGLPKLRDVYIHGPRDCIDVSPLGRCRALAQFSIESCDTSRLDLDGLAPASAIISLGVGNCPNVQALDLSCCAAFPHLELLRVAVMPLQSIDLSPLSACRTLRRLTLDVLEVEELDVTPLADLSSLEVLSFVGRDNRLRGPLLIGENRQVIAPALRAYLPSGALRRKAVPGFLLRDVPFAFTERRFAAARDLWQSLAWPHEKGSDHRADAERIVVGTQSIDIVWEDFATNEGARVARVHADTSRGLSAEHLLFAIAAELGARIAERDHRFFEGLSLVRTTEWEEVPAYQLLLGS